MGAVRQKCNFGDMPLDPLARGILSPAARNKGVGIHNRRVCPFAGFLSETQNLVFLSDSALGPVRLDQRALAPVGNMRHFSDVREAAIKSGIAFNELFCLLLSVDGQDRTHGD